MDGFVGSVRGTFSLGSGESQPAGNKLLPAGLKK